MITILINEYWHNIYIFVIQIDKVGLILFCNFQINLDRTLYCLHWKKYLVLLWFWIGGQASFCDLLAMFWSTTGQILNIILIISLTKVHKVLPTTKFYCNLKNKKGHRNSLAQHRITYICNNLGLKLDHSHPQWPLPITESFNFYHIVGLMI